MVVPELKGLALSGIVFRNMSGVEDHVRPAIGPGDYAAGERAQFAFQIVNAAARGHLTLRTGLFRDGVAVYESPEVPVVASPPSAVPALTDTAIRIPADLAPGDYLMRVEVEDRVPPPHHGKAWQWARLAIAAPRK